MFERFTDRARKVMALANQEAQRFNHEYIGTEHILLGLVKEGSGVGANVLKNLDVDLRKVRLEVEKLVKSGPTWSRWASCPQTPRAKKVIEYAIEEARNLNHNYVGTEHLLLGLLREQDGVAAQVLMNLASSSTRSARRCSTCSARAPNPRTCGWRRSPARERPGPGRQTRQEQDARARQLRPRPDRAGQGQQARPGHRAGGARSSAWCRSSAAAEEQPGAAGRGRRGQDRDRRRAGQDHRRGATCPRCSPIAASSCSTWR
jgi:ATP-dependent Clp protease ATP-binding subunit ClpA